MDVILSVVLPLSLAFIMFSLGLGLSAADFARVLRMPKAVLAGLTAQLAVLPATALALLMVFPLPPELAVGVMILAFSPGGVTSNILTKYAGGSVALSVTLTGIASLLAVVTVPILTAAAVDGFIGAAGARVDVTQLAIAMAAITTAPVALGVGLRAAAPRLVQAVERPASLLATLLFALIVLGALAANWQAFLANIGTLGPLLIALNLGLLAIGFGIARLLALPRPEAVAIALETGVQNGTLGITVGSLIVEAAAGLPPFSLPSGVYGVTMYLVTLPIVFALRRMRGPQPA
ncbi:MAG: bile acid:sodium symporter family protein [Alphaproteobacteria bacterium]|nr:bile acid:sodium symporter family protein [Alphaproteobacteria bacterium]